MGPFGPPLNDARAIQRQVHAAISRPICETGGCVSLVAVAAALLVKNLALDNPMMPGDEYAVPSAAQTFPYSSERFAADPYLPRIYSPVFAAYGRMLFSLTDQPTRLVKALNVLAFVVAMGLFLALIGKISGVGPSGLAAAVFLVFPFSGLHRLHAGELLPVSFRPADVGDGRPCSPEGLRGSRARRTVCRLDAARQAACDRDLRGCPAVAGCARRRAIVAAVRREIRSRIPRDLRRGGMSRSWG